MSHKPGMFEWVDPWQEVEWALSMQDRWHSREDDFYRDMRMAQQAAHDQMYHIRKAYDDLVSKIAMSEQFKLKPIFREPFGPLG